MPHINMKLHDQTIEDLAPGETTRVNHTDCSAGEDTRRRLYLTRQLGEASKTLGYCHNCGYSGVYSKGFDQYRDRLHQPRSSSIQVSDKVTPVPNLIIQLGDFTTFGRAWAIANKITQGMLDEWNIAMTPEGKVYIPRYNENSFFTGYQLRNVAPATKQPKYTTVLSNRDRGYSYFGEKDATNFVIVEDSLSAIHVLEAYRKLGTTNVAAIANHGVRTNVQLLELCLGHSTVVWLDNDSPSVINAASSMARTLQLMSDGDVELVDIKYSDPKHYNPRTILDILEETCNG
jgi:hypothetical protein